MSRLTREKTRELEQVLEDIKGGHRIAALKRLRGFLENCGFRKGFSEARVLSVAEEAAALEESAQ
jgi:hypothetical protein